MDIFTAVKYCCLLHGRVYVDLQLEMEDSDSIDVFQQQTGGSVL